jgi:hypothetical protein
MGGGAGVSVVNAAPLAEIKARDFNGDGLIETGPELDALTALRSTFNGFQNVAYEAALSVAGAKGVAVAAMDDRSYYTRLKEQCEAPKQLFLQDSVSRVSLLQPGFLTASNKGARLSFSYDSLTGATAWNTKGALFWLPKAARFCLLDEAHRSSQSAVVSGYAFAPYIEFAGRGSSTASSTSNLSFGLHGEVQLFGGAFDLQQVSLNPYYRTDFEGRANIYGIHASWQPTHLQSHLNGYVKGSSDVEWQWALAVNADFMSVQNAGLSGLTGGTDYGWIGLHIGATAILASKAMGGTYVGVEYDVNHDVLNDVTADLVALKLGVFLSTDQKSAMELRYENGRDYQTLTNRDEVTLELKINF